MGYIWENKLLFIFANTLSVIFHPKDSTHDLLCRHEDSNGVKGVSQKYEEKGECRNTKASLQQTYLSLYLIKNRYT